MSEDMYLIFQSRINKYYKSMTKGEKSIARYMMDHPENVLTMTTKQLARECNASTASIIRFCQTCGYSGISELKLDLKNEQLSALGPDYPNGESTTQESDIKKLVLGYQIEVVKSLMSSFNEGTYQHAVDEILRAKRILVIAFGGSRSSAVEVTDLLLQLHLPVEMWDDEAFLTMRIAAMEPGDVIIGITYTGRYRSTLKHVKRAYEKGITTIGITGFTDSPFCDYLNVVLGIRPEGSPLYAENSLSARILEMSTSHILYTMLICQQDRLKETGKKADLLLESLRVSPQSDVPEA